MEDQQCPHNFALLKGQVFVLQQLLQVPFDAFFEATHYKQREKTFRMSAIILHNLVSDNDQMPVVGTNSSRPTSS